MKKTILLLFAFMATILLASSVTASPVMNEAYISVSELVEESLYDGNEGTTLGENVLEGEGTAENPYRITSAQDFLCASEMVSSNNSLYAAGVYSIEACIDFDKVSFTPMGTENAPFKGTLLGNGHVLKNISLSDIKHFGVVGYMTQGVVSNVHAEYVAGELTVQNLNRFGGIVGEIYSKSSSKTVTVSGCSANGDVYIKSNDEVVAGGIAGMIEARYSNVYFNDNIANVNLRVVSSTKSYVAGFAGKANAKKDDIYLLIEKCAATGDVYLGDVIGSYAAGFIAYVDCEPKGWSGWVEGMVLLAETETSISKSFVTGNVVSSGKGGAFIADYKDFNKKEVFISKSQTVTAKSGGVNMGTICDDELLSDSEFLAQNMGFDFTNTWEIADDGSLKLQNKCDGEIKVGDVNGDTRVNIQDVILLAQYCAGWDSAKETAVLSASDTNGDTRVNIQDVILLAQYCAGWGVTLG